ncbi:MAG: restriction endonuclease subunit M [Treponema sp.]|nr:restriction endonuclease subunit M [Treponema sp.]
MEFTDQIIQERKVDISETWLWEAYPDAFRKLLIDHSTQKNIIWATNSYEDIGDGYRFKDEITPEKIIGEHGQLIRPRALKDRDEQIRRVKDKAEVFTPSWICNAQNNLIDEAWFGRANVFNEEITLEDGSHTWIPSEGEIEFSDEKGKTWKDYVRDMRLEITCGEAPYLVSRYDAVSGEPISDLKMRVGLLDRKLRVVSENTETSGDWIDWAKTALECTYGYEWQGDNLLLAREALMLTVLDYYRAKFCKEMPKQSIPGLAYIISWNLFQMDGLKYVIPCSCETVTPEDACKRISEIRMEKESKEIGNSLFSAEEIPIAEINVRISENGYAICEACSTGKGDHIGLPVKIRDWKAFHNSANKKNKGVTDVLFRSLINTQR